MDKHDLVLVSGAGGFIGGHLVAVALSRWNDAQYGFAYPDAQWLAHDSQRRAA